MGTIIGAFALVFFSTGFCLIIRDAQQNYDHWWWKKTISKLDDRLDNSASVLVYYR